MAKEPRSYDRNHWRYQMHGCILVYMTELRRVQRKEKAMGNLRRQKLENTACKTTKLPTWSNKGRRLVNVLTNIYTGCCCLQNDFKIMTSCRDAYEVGRAGFMPR